MFRVALIYGGIAGSVIISVMILGRALSGGEGAASGQLFGYLVMVVALSLIFFGVKQYRDRERGGAIAFMPAFLTGLAIAAVASVFYVIGWEIYLAATDYAFIDEYTAGVIEAKRAAGMSEEALSKLIVDMERMKDSYANPALRLPMTFIEIFPIGLLIALISAALLKKPGVSPATV